MKITNKFGLPDALVAAVENDQYTGGGDISVTSLIAPARQRYLMRRYADEIEDDVSDRIWMLLGQAVHSVLEREGEDNTFVEERLSAEIDGWEVSGQTDRYDGAKLIDYKVTSAWTMLDDRPVRPEWERQLNCYAYIWQVNGFAVDSLQILAILRDWSRREAQRNPGYPQQPALLRPVRLWRAPDTRAYMERRVAEHRRAEATAAAETRCDDDERWTKPAVWAVMPRGNKRAHKLCLSQGEAERVARLRREQTRRPHDVQYRAGENVRCENYCPVRDFCSQYAEMKESPAA